MVTMSHTPSDVNACHQTRRDVRRLLVRDGMLETPEPRTPSPPRQLSRIELIERRLTAIEQKLGLRG